MTPACVSVVICGYADDRWDDLVEAVYREVLGRPEGAMTGQTTAMAGDDTDGDQP